MPTIILLIHGVPKGHATWGTNDENEKRYLQSFYGNHDKIESKLQVEIRLINNSRYCYYTYIRKGNISDINGRIGSYFAITIKIDEYYKDLFNLHNILDASYNKLILGEIINRDNKKYRIRNFDECDNTIKTIKTRIIDYLNNYYDQTDFCELNDDFNITNNTTYINLLNCNENTVFDLIKKNGNLSISPVYASMETIEKDKQITSLTITNRDKQTEIERLKGEKTQNSDLKSKFEFAKNEINNKNIELTSLKNKLVTKEQELNKANETLSKNATYSNEISKNSNGYNSHTQKIKKTKLDTLIKYIPLINAVLSMLIIILIVIGMCVFAYQNKFSKNIDCYNETKNTTQSQNSDSSSNTNESNKQSGNESTQEAIIENDKTSNTNESNKQAVNKSSLEAKIENDKTSNTNKSNKQAVNKSSLEAKIENDKTSNTNKSNKQAVNKSSLEAKIENDKTSNTNESNKQPANKPTQEARIDFPELNKNNTTMELNKPYRIRLLHYNGKGQWSSSDFAFNKDSTTITPKKRRNCIINYHSNDNKISLTRTINVK